MVLVSTERNSFRFHHVKLELLLRKIQLQMNHILNYTVQK